MSNLAWAAEASGDPGRAAALHQQAITAARSAGDDWGLGVALNNYAMFRRAENRSAHELAQEALNIRRRIGEPRAIAITAANLAELALDADEIDDADTLNDEALRASHGIDYRVMIAATLGTRAIIALLRDDVQSAGAQLQEAIGRGRHTTWKPRPRCFR